MRISDWSSDVCSSDLTRRLSTAYQPVVSIMKTLNFSAIRARQSPEHTVLSFAARASELQRFAAIERVGRDETGKLNGFKRPQIAGHIREIRDFPVQPEAILPNPIRTEDPR